jgi:hypothetical protein
MLFIVGDVVDLIQENIIIVGTLSILIRDAHGSMLGGLTLDFYEIKYPNGACPPYYHIRQIYENYFFPNIRCT